MIIWMWLKRVVEDGFCKYDAKISDFLSLKINYKDNNSTF